MQNTPIQLNKRDRRAFSVVDEPFIRMNPETTKLSVNAFWILVHLTHHAVSKDNDFKTEATNKTIAEWTGIDEKHINRHLKEIEDLGFIKRETGEFSRARRARKRVIKWRVLSSGGLVIPKSLIDDANVSKRAMRVYGALYRYAYAHRANGMFSMRHIYQVTGVSIDALNKGIAELAGLPMPRIKVDDGVPSIVRYHEANHQIWTDEQLTDLLPIGDDKFGFWIWIEQQNQGVFSILRPSEDDLETLLQQYS